MQQQSSRRLIARTLQATPTYRKQGAVDKMEQIRRNLPTPPATATPLFPKGDPLRIQDRTIDCVVDCLLRELTW